MTGTPACLLPHSLLSPQLRVQFSTDSRVQKMFEILLDGNSKADKLEKVGAGPAAGGLGTCQVTALPLQTLLLCLGGNIADRLQAREEAPWKN